MAHGQRWLVVLLVCYSALGQDAQCSADGSCQVDPVRGTAVHTAYKTIIKEYPFQPVVNERHQHVNIILVRSPFRSKKHQKIYERYKDEILFLGMCSFEDYPLVPPNPFSSKYPADYYPGLFSGFLHMFRDPSFFPDHVKLGLLSQSDFALPHPDPPLEKKYDFVFSGSDQDVHNDCVGWSSYAKNWTFVKEALEVMCGEYNLKGVLVATKAKQGEAKCSIPAACKGKIKQTRYIPQNEFFSYVRKSRFAFAPQVHDASPRTVPQFMAHDLPVLMNWHIVGGWKYVNEHTGEFFHDLSDLRQSLDRLLKNIEEKTYSPQRFIFENYGDRLAGAKFKKFVEEQFADRITLPQKTQLLLPTGA